ncbi:MAG: hypothetical protein ACLU4J_09030 [Butyricimonas paravirosa]
MASVSPFILVGSITSMVITSNMNPAKAIGYAMSRISLAMV